MKSYIVTCRECSVDLDSHLIFAHLREYHRLHFDVYEVTSLRTVAFEHQADELEAKINSHAGPLFRRLYRWRLRRIRREIDALRDGQIRDLLGAPRA